MKSFLEEYFDKQEDALAAWDSGEEEADYFTLCYCPPITDGGTVYSAGSWAVEMGGMKAPGWLRKYGLKPRPLESRKNRGYGFVVSAQANGFCNYACDTAQTFRLGEAGDRSLGDRLIKYAREAGWRVDDTGWHTSPHGGAKHDKNDPRRHARLGIAGENRLPVFQTEYRSITLCLPVAA